MPTYTYTGFSTSAFNTISGSGVEGNAGDQFQLDPMWDASDDGWNFQITDDDANWSGDLNNNETGDDATQQDTVVTNESGANVGTGVSYLEQRYSFVNENGTTVNIFRVEIGGTHVGYVADGPLQPGTVYTLTATSNVTDSDAPAYTEIDDQTYDRPSGNTMDGMEENDTLDGGDGADTISGEGRNDSISGGAGNDSIEGGSGNDSIEGGADNDTIRSDFGNNTLDGGTGDDSITGGNATDLIYGGTGADTIDAQQSSDTVYGGDGNDSILGRSGSDLLEGGDGSDTIYGGADNDTLRGDAGDDFLDGQFGNNTLEGGTGNDTLLSGSGNDSMSGGDDADTFIIEEGFGNDTVVGGEGGTDSDTLDLTAMTSAVTVTYSDEDSGTITDGSDTITFSEIEYLELGSGDDSVDATIVHNGLNGDHTGININTGAGNDTVDAGRGGDTIDGGSGQDVIDGDYGDDSIRGGADNDTLTGGDGNDTLEGDEGDDSLIGGLQEDELYGGSGSDTLSGGDGDDILDGGDDADTFLIEDGDDNDTITGGEGGTDSDSIDFTALTNSVTINYTGNESGTASFGSDTITFSEIENMFLTDQDDSVDGSGDSVGMNIFAEDGNDTITGGDGADNIEGGIGADSLTGGDGNDTLDGGAGDDTLVAGYDDGAGDVFIGGSGTDTYQIAGSEVDAFGYNVNLVTGLDQWNNSYNGIENIEGGSGNDTFTGDTEDNMFSGGSGDDCLVGGGGNDTLEGGTGDDTLISGTGDNSLTGGDGSDRFVIEDGYGNDTIIGGEGGSDDDTLDFTNLTSGVSLRISGTESGYSEGTTDTITFSQIEKIELGQSDDKISFGINSGVGLWADGNEGEDTILGSSHDDTFFGGDGDDYLVGNGGADSIDGGANDDSLIGGTGDDTLTGGAGDDTFSYSAGHGNDTFTDFNTGNTGTLSDGNANNNDYINLSGFYDNLSELYADQADDGVLNQSNATDTKGRSVDYSDNSDFGTGSLTITGASADNSSFTQENTGVVCFAQGSLIATPKGPRPVESLRKGDEVSTLDNGTQKILWIECANVMATGRLAPILIKAHSLGEGLPQQDLYVSPNHRILAKSAIIRRRCENPEVLIAAKALLPLEGVERCESEQIILYFHLMLERHEVLFANGAPAESLYLGPFALRALPKAAKREIFEIFPSLGSGSDPPEPARPFVGMAHGQRLVGRHQQKSIQLLEGL